MGARGNWKRYACGLIGAFAAAGVLLAATTAPSSAASPGPRYGTEGWAGYAWHTNSRQVTASLRLPTVSGASNAGAAFWAGFGTGPGIEQTGFSANMVADHLSYTAWYELYPAPPVGFGQASYPGDHVTMTVVHLRGAWFKLSVRDATRHWTASVIRRAGTVTLNAAEVIVEAYGPPLARFSPVMFYNVNVRNAWAYGMPGSHVSGLGRHSFRVSG
ncbi:MAG TPA: G1 family glutamic endopeptidase [Trebonia sp.]|jgi:hypothetical protein|nr:G1 family glutamic endopeptidase [Trebonia sp.]